MAFATPDTDASRCLAHLPTSFPIAHSLATSQVSGNALSASRRSRSVGTSSESNATIKSCFIVFKASRTPTALSSVSCCMALATRLRIAWSVGHSAFAGLKTSSASSATPARAVATPQFANNCSASSERAASSTAAAMPPIAQASTAHRACRCPKLEAASTPPQVSLRGVSAEQAESEHKSLAMARCAMAHSPSSSVPRALMEAASISSSLAAPASVCGVAMTGEASAAGSSPSSSAHSRSYMLPPAIDASFALSLI
mmetsp:Transcript_101166/g.291300  ORF Transcript_101166/g.291300 Transcript_101166/m.291300 type:complete len:257 (-) Transcript_101166:1817-2587(-)